MKKRIFAALVALALTLIPACGMAAPGDATLLRRDMDGFNDSIRSMAYLDGVLYLMTSNAIYTCPDGASAAERHEIEFPQPEEENTYADSALLFEDRGELKFLTVVEESYEEDGEWYSEIVGARLYRALFDASGFSFEEEAELDWGDMVEDEGDNYEYSIRMRQPFAINGVLYFTAYGNSGVLLMGYDLEEGEVALEEEIPNLEGVCRYRDGKLLLLAFESEEGKMNLRFEAYDPEEEESELLLEMPAPDSDWPGQLLYDEEEDALYFVLAGELWRMDGMNPETARSICAIALDRWTDIAPVLTNDKCFVGCDYDTVLRRGTDPDARAETRLVVQHDYQSAVENAAFTFGNAHGEVEIVLVQSYEDVLQAMMNRSPAVDIYCLSASSAEFSALYERGFLAEMTDSEFLSEFAKSAYPAFQEALFREGELVAIPLYVDSNVLSVSAAALERLGISKEELPASWDRFPAFLESLPEKMEQRPEMMIVDPFTTQERFYTTLFDHMLSTYLAVQRHNGGEIALDTELFRHLADQIENLDFEALGLPEEQTETSFSYEEGDLLIETYSSLSNCLYSWNSSIPLLPALKEGEAPAVLAELRVLVINPYSQNREIALAFVEEVARQIDHQTRILLSPEYNEPVENSYFAANLESYDEQIAALEEELENAPEEEREEQESFLESMRESRQEMIETSRWEISPESIAQYREYAQHYLLRRHLGMDEQEFFTLKEQYLSGAISIDEVIREVDGKLRMMMLENA